MEDLADVLKPLAALVVKDGVCLGGLKPAQRRAVLALAACAIERGAALREADVNASLRAFLKGDGVFIATDHVELQTSTGGVIRLDVAQVAAATPRILGRYKIPHDRSPGLPGRR